MKQLDPRTIDMAGALAILDHSVSERTVRRMLADGRLTGRKSSSNGGGKWIISRKSLDKYLEEMDA